MAIYSIKSPAFKSYIIELLSTFFHLYNQQMSQYLRINSGESNGYSPPHYWKGTKPAVIDMNNNESLEKWEAILHLSRSELIDAISLFGPVVRDIRKGLLNSQDEAA